MSSTPLVNVIDACKLSSTIPSQVINPGEERKHAPPTPKVDTNGLYLLLSSTELRDKYHWGLLVAQNETGGILYHQVLSGLDWNFIVGLTDLAASPDHNLLLALKIGIIEKTNDEWIQAIKACVRSVEVEGQFTCRTWALAAVYQLASQGFIGMQPEWVNVFRIEEEAKRLAMDAYDLRTTIVIESEMSAG
ncbi:hypothetical protein FQN53_002275 [Emmonsiellopsis sp. PD_33]|nr:hypothetical protein FQN53_002275 [Emmonsiellopsis sp. PD_33]